jgi:hypothetical protein
MTKFRLTAALGVSAVFTLVTAAHAQSLTATKASVQDSTLTVESLEVPQDGWLVAHTVQDGQAGPHVGHAQVASGSNDNVQITLDQPVSSGDKVVLMLHEDTGTAGTFEFEAGAAETKDAPAMADGQPVQAEVTVE